MSEAKRQTGTNWGQRIQALLEAGFLGDVLDAGFALAEATRVLDFDVLAVAAFLALVAPVTVVLAGAFLVVDFLAGDAFFAGARLAVVPEDFAFFAAEAYFLVVGADLVVVRVLGAAAAVAFDLAAGRAAGAFLAGEGFAALAGAVVDFLEAGLAAGLLAGAFSLAASLRDLGASLTLPEGPFGRMKVPFSAPWVMALLSWLAAVALREMRYLASTNFLIVGRETPARASAGCATMHSFIISTHVG